MMVLVFGYNDRSNVSTGTNCIRAQVADPMEAKNQIRDNPSITGAWMLEISKSMFVPKNRGRKVSLVMRIA